MDVEYFKTREAVMESIGEFANHHCPYCDRKSDEIIFNNQDYDRFVAELSRKGYKIFKEILP